MPSNDLQKLIDAYRARLGRAMRDAAPDSRAIFLNHALNFSGPLIHDIFLELQEAERQRDQLLVALERLRPTYRNPNCFCLGSHDLKMYGHSSACRFATTAIASAKGEPRG